MQLLIGPFYPTEQPKVTHHRIPKIDLIKAKSRRKQMKVLTKYEKTRLLGTRALQIAMNAKILIDPKGETDPLKIAEMELEQRRIPLKVRRELPDGTIEIYKIEELLIL